jgi:hypothetical protein
LALGLVLAYNFYCVAITFIKGVWFMSFLPPFWLLGFVFLQTTNQNLPATKVVEPEATAPAPDNQPLVIQGVRPGFDPARDAVGQAYQSDVLKALQEQEVLMGALEGSWVVTQNDGNDILALELRTEDVKKQKVSGAWRYLIAEDGWQTSGLLDRTQLKRKKIKLKFYEKSSHKRVILWLKQGDDGIWTGKIRPIKGPRQNVTLIHK